MYTHDFSLANNSTPAYLNAAGRYIRYVAATLASSAPKVRIKTDKGHEFDLMPGQDMVLPDKVGQFRLTNKDLLSTINGSMMVGDGAMNDGRVSGEVMMVDGSYARSLGLTAFTAFFELAASPGNLGHIQLQNQSPTRLAVVHTIRFALDAVGSAKMSVRDHTPLGVITGNVSIPKYSGGSGFGTVCDVRTGVNAVPLGGAMIFAGADQKGTEIRLQDPIILPQGRGVMVCCHTANTAFNATFEHYFIPL